MDFQVVKKPKYKISIYGKDFEMSRPTVMQANKIRKQLGAGENQEVELFITFLVELGLPNELVPELEMEHFVGLAEFLLNAKKN